MHKNNPRLGNTPLFDIGLNLRPLSRAESLILTNRYATAFVALSKLADSLQSRAPLDQAGALMGFAFENADLLNDVVVYASDQHSNRAAVEALPIDSKLLALGQILALTGTRMQAEETQFADTPAPSAAVH